MCRNKISSSLISLPMNLQEGRTALTIAARNDNKPALELLLAMGALVDVQDTVNNYLYLPIYAKSQVMLNL